MKGSDSGPVVVPGSPDKSLLIKAIRYDGDVKMPPKGKLPAEEIEALTTWVKLGAPWPEAKRAVAAPGAASADSESWKKHWAFQPVRKPAIPKVKDLTWAASPIDRLVLARLEAKGLSPSPAADRRTLIRRATLDLIGLPPTLEEVEAFEQDPSPDAFAKVVGRLLASPRYGERWGRYWLDVARYADTKGYLFDQERRFPSSYTYRDYAIQAFNDDLPYDQFVIQQIAADRLSPGEDKRPLAAMGFLTLGGRFMNNNDDIIDDRIDVVTRGFLGLTVTCARCHDHKFDPIPTKDYYSLYGVFAASVEPKALPVIKTPDKTEAYAAYEKGLKDLEESLNRFLKTQHAQAAAHFRARIADYLLAAHQANGHPRTDEFMFVIKAGELNPLMVQRWQHFLDETRKTHHPILAPWHAFAALPAAEFAAKAPSLAAAFAHNADPAKTVNPLVARIFAGRPPASLGDVARRYGWLFNEIDLRAQIAELKSAFLRKRAVGNDSAQEEIFRFLHAPGSPPAVPLDEIASYLLDRPARKQLQTLREKIDNFKGLSPGAPPRAMVLVDGPPNNYDARVFIRGNPRNRGEAVPRQFLEVLAGPNRQPFKNGSGRLDMAQAIVRPDNPLTARVLVNRIWLHHFGTALVRTPSDFGLRSEPPTHPELLDYLATRFMEDGWSIKKLHRLIMLSCVYAESSTDRPECRAIDPDNRYYWRMNRRRLDFEALRDSLLAVAGVLDGTMGGRPIDLTTAPFSTRRTVYGFVDRQNLPGLFRVFDFPNPDATCPQRYETTVPLQALFLMNSPFIMEQSRRLANRAQVLAQAEALLRIQQLYRLVYSRDPDPQESALALSFVQDRARGQTGPGESGKSLTPWERLAQVLLLANEFAFLD
jgi:hypothetical protein